LPPSGHEDRSRHASVRSLGDDAPTFVTERTRTDSEQGHTDHGQEHLRSATCLTTPTGDDLVQLFQTYGTVTSAQVIIDKFSGRSRGFGFVEMANDDESQAAIDALNGSPFGGRPLTVNEARPREERGGQGGGRQSRRVRRRRR